MTVELQMSAGSKVGGEFKIIKPLNAGGMGAVFVAEQETTGKLRALKMMHRELVADAKLRERFEQEARVGSMIPSDHIVQVIGAGVDQATGMPWLAMELLEGEDLAARLSARGPIPASEALPLFEQICHGLGAAHAAGVVHRDMKPENIFLAKTRTAASPVSVKILDFGIARVAAEAKTVATAAIGTPLWMAPEQSDPRAPITPRADVWSLGLIAFSMLVGRPFWRTASDPLAAMTAVMREILLEPIAPATRRAGELGYRGTLPEAFDAWFARCVVREPAARFADASEAMDALKPALTSAPVEILGSAAFVGADSSMDTQGFLDLANAPTNVAPLAGDATLPFSAGAEARGAALGATDRGVSITASKAATNPEPSRGGAATGDEAGPRRRPLAGRPAVLFFGAVAVAAITAGVVISTTKNPRHRQPALAAAEGSAAHGNNSPEGPARAVDTTPPKSAPEIAPAPASAAVSPQTSASPRASGSARASAPAASASAKADLPPFDPVAAQRAVNEMARVAQFICAPREGPKAIPATVYFGPTGGVRRVELDFSVINTSTGMCAQSQLMATQIRPFKSDTLPSVSTVVVLK